MAVDEQRVLAVLEQLGHPNLPRAVGRGIPFVERVVGRHLTAEWQRPALRAHRLVVAAKLDLGAQQLVACPPVLVGLAGKTHVVQRVVLLGCGHGVPPVRRRPRGRGTGRALRRARECDGSRVPASTASRPAQLLVPAVVESTVARRAFVLEPQHGFAVELLESHRDDRRAHRRASTCSGAASAARRR